MLEGGAVYKQLLSHLEVFNIDSEIFRVSADKAETWTLDNDKSLFNK